MAANDTFSPKQRAALVTLLTEATIAAAAVKAHVSERTLHRWLKLPQFAAALERQRAVQIEESLALLRSSMGAAVRKAAHLIEVGNPSIALKASALLLEHAMRLRAEQSMSMPDARKLVRLTVDSTLETLREMGVDEYQARMRLTQKLREKSHAQGWDVTPWLSDPQTTGATNGHAS